MVDTKRRLTRPQLAEFLSERGYPISYSTLEKLCIPSAGKGPPDCGKWGKRPLYCPDEAIAWAEARLRPADQQATA
jgi:hypothetical protein